MPRSPREGFQPSRGSFKRKQALSPRQSAHGLYVRRRVTHASARGDEDAAVGSLVIKEVNKAVPSKADYESCHSGDKGTIRRYAPSQRHRGAPCGISLSSWMDSGFSCHGHQLSAMDRVHGQPLYRALYKEAVHNREKGWHSESFHHSST